MFRNIRWGIILIGAGVIVGLFGFLQLRPPALNRHVYRIGWMISPPFQVRGADGKAAGISVDLVNEAAHRRGLTLEWVFWASSSESALRSKHVDLWPLITITPERLKHFYISEPYLQHEHCLLVRYDSRYRTIEDLADATIGVSNVSIDAPQLHGVLPKTKILAHPLIESVIEDTCNGRSDATYADKYTAISGLLEVPRCGGHTLRWIALPQVRSRLGVGSTFESRAAADALRKEIGVIAREGRLAAIFGQWGFMTGQDVYSVEALVDARRRETRLIVSTALFALLFGLTCWQTVRLYRERNRTRDAQAALRESQARYMQAQKLEGIGRLAGGIAHDFNNLLTVINGYSEITLGKLSAVDPLRSSVEQIRKAGQRAADLTQQLLVFGRKQVTQLRRVSLNAVIRDSERMFRRLLGEDIEVTTRLNPDVGLVLADSGQIHQVLLNLLVNARDAMPDGGSLAIETASTNIDESYTAKRPEASAGKAAVLTVTDTGHGMDEQTIEHIFEPFYTTKGLTKGTGLGLATVYAIVQQSRGWISVQSKPGKGSVFQIYLPSIEGDDLAETTPVPQGAQLRGSETVLVVEDEVDVRTFAVSALEAYGYRVLDACDGAQALGLSGHFRDNIDVLLTDVVMPGINGRDLAERFKSARPGIAILYTSGYTDDVIAHRGVLDASVAYLPKPYTAGDLVAKVREVLKERAER